MYGPDGEGYRPKTEGNLVKILASIVVFAIGYAIFHVGAGYFKEEITLNTLFNRLESDPKTSAMYQSFKRNFPEDYERYKSDVTGAAKIGDVDSHIIFAQNWIARYRTQHFDKVMRNKPDVLLSIFYKNANVIETMREYDVAACAAFASGRAFEIPASSDPHIFVALSESGAALFDAIKTGKSLPPRFVPDPSEEDVKAYYIALVAQHVPAPLIAILTERTAQAGASEEDQCNAGVAFYQTIGAMKEPARSVWAAYVLNITGRSEEPPPP